MIAARSINQCAGNAQVTFRREVALSEQGLNLALIERLIATDWLRKIPMMLNAALYFWLMTRVVRTDSVAHQ